jgi:hypothetical protein
MGSKYREYSTSKHTSNRDYQRVHPVWRGVGFAFIILIPIISYAATEVLLQQNGIHNWFPLPFDMLAKPGQFFYDLIPDPMLYIKAMFFVAFMLILFAIFTLFSFLISGFFGASVQKDPFYVPPVRRRRRRRF